MREGRTALVITILLIATLTVPAIAFGSRAFVAEAQQSPSPTGTAPAIQLLNPSDYNGNARPVISDKDNNPNTSSPDDQKYHFNAWTRNAPNNASVEFFIVQGSNQLSLGLATNRGGGVYDVYSAIPDQLAEGNAVVRVVMFSGGEVARDEQDVEINQDNDEPANEPVIMQGEYGPWRAAETTELTYPQNTGSVGFFGRSATVEMTHSRTGTAGSGPTQGGGPENIRVFYTTSFRGTDPDWKQCGEENQSNSANGVQCTLTGSDTPEMVTAIAALTRDSEAADDVPPVSPSAADNAGDAHAASGYTQVPTGVTLSQPNVASVPNCTPFITVTVNDQIGRKVVGAPLDVHAVGPADSLAFNTEDDETSTTDNTQPDDNDQPENHATEPGRKCSNNNISEENQGEHEEVGAQPDRKHIESTDGTDAAGQFTFRLWSDTAGGTTNTAFVDLDDNDRFCASEASGNGIVNWGTGGPAAPQPAGPEEQVCSGSSTSPASSSSPSNTASTTSPSSTASQSTSPSSTSPSSPSSSSPSTTASSPSGTSSTTTSGTTTGTGTGTSPQQATREVSLETSRSRTKFGKSFTLSGAVTSTNPACTDFVTVQITRDVLGGEDEFELLAQEQTDANGAYSLTVEAERSANYIAQVLETATCDDASSSPQPVLVRVKVGLRLSRTRVESGDRVRFRIKTAPCPATARDKVLLFRAIQGQFGKSGRKRTNQRCAATIVRRVNDSAVFQARWPKQSPQFLAGKSRSKAVRVRD